jgi:uridine kinase
MKTTIIGITGGSGSGKTYLANKLIDIFKKDTINIIKMDSYYKDLGSLTMQEREVKNFDQPNAFDFELLIKHLNILFNTKTVGIPIYDYKTHTRKIEKEIINITPVIIIEGIFSIYYKKLRDLMDLTIFIDTPNATRKERRIIRDKKSRDRTLKSILHQYEKMVEPMYIKYISPMKKKSDLIIKENDKNNLNINKLVRYINSKI